MTGDGFIRLAGKLVAVTGLGEDESRLRTAVSRAYYGAFHLTTALLTAWQFELKRNAYGHQEAYNMLWRSGHAEAQKVASLLDDLRTERIKADYRLDDSRFWTPETAIMCVEMAETLRIALDTCRSDEESIRDAIRQGLSQ